MRPKILGTGLSGMVGSRIVELLGGKYELEDLSLEKGVDITNRQVVLEKLQQFSGQVALHLAAKTDVDECEKDKGSKEEGGAWKVNVLGTKNLVEACLTAGKKIIYISTDFVFDGENPSSGGYSEEDQANPVNWYAQTKYEGEKIVQKMGGNWIICRLAFPYRARFPAKKDFVRAILSHLEKDERVQVVTDQIITPTFIDNIAYALEQLIEQGASGIYHLVGSQSLTPYQAACLIAQTFGLPENLIEQITTGDYFQGRAKRPFNLTLRNDKIKKLGVEMSTFEEGLEEVKRQIENSKS